MATTSWLVAMTTDGLLEKLDNVVQELERLAGTLSLLATILDDGAQTKVADGLHVEDWSLVLVLLLIGLAFLPLATFLELLVIDVPANEINMNKWLPMTTEESIKWSYMVKKSK